jgi:hypothetical protein
MNVTVRKRAGNDSVIVIRISLCFHQCHAATGGAAFEVRVLRVFVVERIHNLFGFHRHFMRCPVAKIDHLFGMADRPVSALFLVAGISAGRRVAET